MTEEDYVKWIQPLERQMNLTAWRIDQNSDDADDILQVALKRIWKNRAK